MSSNTSETKTLRSFHARNILWVAFEKKSELMDCSVDYLLNEAMRQYAISNDMLKKSSEEDDSPETSASTKEIPAAAESEESDPESKRDTLPPIPKPGELKAKPASPKIPRPAGARPKLPAPAQSPPFGDTGQDEARQPLYLIFQGRKLTIDTDQFIIGRGSKKSDLAIKDANISRKHAAVIFHRGAYYIKDLGSTNGIEYNGKAVDSKRINEGDVFSICNYDLHFTYLS